MSDADLVQRRIRAGIFDYLELVVSVAAEAPRLKTAIFKFPRISFVVEAVEASHTPKG